MITNNTAARFHSIRCRLYAARLSTRAKLLDVLHAFRDVKTLALLLVLVLLSMVLGSYFGINYLRNNTVITYDECFMLDTPFGTYYQPDPDYLIYEGEKVQIAPAAWLHD